MLQLSSTIGRLHFTCYLLAFGWSEQFNIVSLESLWAEQLTVRWVVLFCSLMLWHIPLQFVHLVGVLMSAWCTCCITHSNTGYRYTTHWRAGDRYASCRFFTGDWLMYASAKYPHGPLLRRLKSQWPTGEWVTHWLLGVNWWVFGRWKESQQTGVVIVDWHVKYFQAKVNSHCHLYTAEMITQFYIQATQWGDNCVTWLATTKAISEGDINVAINITDPFSCSRHPGCDAATKSTSLFSIIVYFWMLLL